MNAGLVMWLGLLVLVVAIRGECAAESRAKGVVLTPAEQALKVVLDRDPCYSEITGYVPQQELIEAWEQLLSREDLPLAIRVLAYYELGTKLAYQLDPARGEKADYARASEAFERIREIAPWLITMETANMRGVWATCTQDVDERCQRLVTAYRWVREADVVRVRKSAMVVNNTGGLVPNSVRPWYPALKAAEKEQKVAGILKAECDALEGIIRGLVTYGRDDTRAAFFYSQIGDVARSKFRDFLRNTATQKFGAHIKEWRDSILAPPHAVSEDIWYVPGMAGLSRRMAHMKEAQGKPEVPAGALKKDRRRVLGVVCIALGMFAAAVTCLVRRRRRPTAQ